MNCSFWHRLFWVIQGLYFLEILGQKMVNFGGEFMADFLVNFCAIFDGFCTLFAPFLKRGQNRCEKILWKFCEILLNFYDFLRFAPFLRCFAPFLHPFCTLFKVRKSTYLRRFYHFAPFAPFFFLTKARKSCIFSILIKK